MSTAYFTTSQHQRRWEAKNHVRSDGDQGRRSSLLQLGVQEGRCRPKQTASLNLYVHLTHRVNEGRCSAGELNSDELERIVTIIQNPTQFKIPTWFLNRQKDIVDGKNSQILSNGVDSKLREDLERLKKIRAHRGLRHFWGLRVRGQHTKTTGKLTKICIIFLNHLEPSFRTSGKDCWCIEETRLKYTFLLSQIW